ncbi:putative nuclear pore complex protein [Apostichopus japonicus]|uniref:Nuclear pore complex protein Nup85 n=1 Tax=Stichopus japonicus TaxID=307972 RepID=A0A2G8KDN8_STIJA|nr:putative nuclear pore complex protein [Apostichopus japonicus]
MAMQRREIPEFIIPVSGSQDNLLSARWGQGLQLMVFSGNGKRRYMAGEADVAVNLDKPSVVHDVRWQTDMHYPATRKLAAQSHEIFTSLQKHTSDATDGTKKPQLVKFSRRYRVAMMECLEDLRKAASDMAEDEGDQDTYKDMCQLYQQLELIWNLCEILYIENLPGGVILQQLLDWVKLHFTDADSLAAKIISEGEINISKDYWSAVYIYVLQGRLSEARHLLSMNPETQHDVHGAYARIDELMRRMPVFSVFSRQSLAEFDLKWRNWQEICQQLLVDGVFVSYQPLETICRILAGQQDVLDQLQDLAGDWYQIMVTKLLYTNPMVKAVDLQYHAKSCMDKFRGSSRLLPLDQILLAALEYDVTQIIKISSSSLSNWWFVAHLADLLHHAGQLETHQLDFGATMREFLLLEYASTLMARESMWQIIIEYLEHCPVFGRHIYPRGSVLTDLFAVSQSICKVMGMRALQEKRLGTALTWCLRSQDASFATYLAEKFLTEYSLNGNFSNLDLIDNLGSSMLVSDRLTFLAKYRDFHRLYEEAEFAEAGELLLSLIEANLAPKQFMLILLTDALPLLELDVVVFSSKQTSQLLMCKENLLKWYQSEEYTREILPKKSKGHVELEKEKMELLQLGLSRNLSRALLEESVRT